MFRLRKNRNILCSLRDRELNCIAAPYKLSLNVISQLIRSENTYYKYSWYKQSLKPIIYDFGLLYFDNHTSCYSVYGSSCQPSLSHNLKARNAKKKIIDVIAYNTPVHQTFEHCQCTNSKCSCASRFILCLTDDSWLCQYNLNTGELVTETYVQRIDCKIKFKYCDWDEYAERIVLTSLLNPYCEKRSSKSDVVVYMAIFTTFPIEFSVLFEVRRTVFGSTCKHVNVADQLLILGMGYDRVHIYNFSDVLAEGKLQPYKLGEEYGVRGKIGEYPLGLPFNFHIESAPPLLFDVQCFGQSVCFGGFPYHSIFPDPKNHLRFIIQNIAAGDSLKTDFVESNVWNDEPNIVTFYPDNSNRVMSRELHRVRVYEMTYRQGRLVLKESHSMDFQNCLEKENLSEFNAFGRRIHRRTMFSYFISDRSILATDYEDELDLFGILGVCSGDAKQTGFIKLYDSFSGEEVKCIRLKQNLCDTNYYQLHIDREIIIVIEKDPRNLFTVYLYHIAEWEQNVPIASNQ